VGAQKEPYSEIKRIPPQQLLQQIRASSRLADDQRADSIMLADSCAAAIPPGKKRRSPDAAIGGRVGG
jgi:hypothetical protein